MPKQTHNRDYLVDYLIPVIRRMQAGEDRKEVMKDVATALGVVVGTVHDRCRRLIDLDSIYDFDDLVRAGRIKAHLLNKFPDRNILINREL